MKKSQKYSILALRIILGALFLYAGLDKLLNDFSATGYLLYATSGPFKDIYENLTDSVVVDNLVIWGEILIGGSLLLGVFVRFASLMGAIMMGLFYLSVLPPEHGYITEHIIYIVAFYILGAFSAGKIFGVDKYLTKTQFVKNHKSLSLLLS